MQGAGWACAEASAASELQHFLHHGADAVVDVVEGGIAHEGRGRDHLVLLVHVSLVHTGYGKTPAARTRTVWYPAPPRTPKSASPSCATTAPGRGFRH